MRVGSAHAVMSATAIAGSVVVGLFGSYGTATAASITSDGVNMPTYAAGPGETNDIVVTAIDALTVRVSDTGAVIRAGGNCRLLDAHHAECPDAGLGFKVMAGDMNDRVTTQGAALFADGGPGADTLSVVGTQVQMINLVGGPGDDRLIGGDGIDFLIGGPGRDSVSAGAGDDEIRDDDVSGAGERDDFDGGPGRDTLSYDQRTDGVLVDLRPAVSGVAGIGGAIGEADTLRNIEAFDGGLGPDVFEGNASANTFSGGPGSDRLIGRGGADRLLGGAGLDAIRAGPGDDEVTLERVRADGQVSCGRGRSDRVRWPARDDVLPADCEYVATSDELGSRLLLVGLHPRWRSSNLAFTVRCPRVVTHDDDAPKGVLGTVDVTERGGRERLVGHGRLNRVARACHHHATRFVTPVLLNRLGRRLARRPSGLSATVEFNILRFDDVHWGLRLALGR